MLGLTQAARISDFFTRQLHANDVDIRYSEKLDCITCVRAGYDYCPFNKMCLPDANSDMFCSNQYDEKLNFIYNFCQESEACDAAKFNTIKMNNQSVYGEIIGLEEGKGCTFKVNTTCGYPQVNLTFVNTVASDYDVHFAQGEWNYTEDFNATLFRAEWFEDNERWNLPGD